MRNSEASERRTAWCSACGWCLAVLLALVLGRGARPAAAQGAPTWVARYDGGGNDFSFAMAVANGNVYVTGSSYNGSNYDIATVKFDTNGNPLWVQRYDGPGHGPDSPGSAMVVDAVGNVYVAGWSWGGGGTGYDYVTLKYDTNGTLLWERRYVGPGIPGNDEGQALAVNDIGNVYVTGRSVRTVGSTEGEGYRWRWDITTLKYDANGTLLWVDAYDGPGHGWDTPVAIAVDAARNVYVTGTVWGGDAASWDYMTLKYNTVGTQLWETPYFAPGNSDDLAQAMAVDANGNAYVTGYSGNDIVTVRVDPNGNLVWDKPYTGPGSPIPNYPPAIALDTAGNAYVTGPSWGGATGFDWVTLKYDSNGTRLWATPYRDAGNSDDRPQAIAVDTSGNVYVSGYSVGDGISQDYVTMKYDTNGNAAPGWPLRYDDPLHGPDFGGATVVDSSGSVYVTGSEWGGTSYDYGTVKYAGSNAPPVVGSITGPGTPLAISTTFNASASFTDPNALDTHTALWNWGDGTSSAGIVSEVNHTVSGSHSYTTPGVYTITLTVSDNRGGSGQSPPFQYLVAYDPTGGFVTGSGQIQSPPGAFPARPTVTGKAHFGFNSKYQPGATVPDGKTQFRFQEADMDFRSTAYDWLVVAGARAQFKGTGTINGTGSYSFLLTAIDGQVNGGGGVDRFRIKIWSSGGVYYDNQIGASDDADPSTSLESGNIVIHKP